LGLLARSVSRVTVALSNVSSVSQLFSFPVGCSGMILKGFGFVTFLAGVKASFISFFEAKKINKMSGQRSEEKFLHLFAGRLRSDLDTQ
jgi:hypothetical protein